MLTFIPVARPSHFHSPGEEKVYDWLKEAEMSGIVMHSIGLAEHVTKIYGEIDYLIITAQGICCLEVKGGGVEVKDGIWYYTNRFGQVIEADESPFTQVEDNKYSLRNVFKAKFESNTKIKNTIFVSGVVFPDVVFNYHNISHDHEMIMDRSKEGRMKTFIEGLFKRGHQKVYERTGYHNNPLTDGEIYSIKSWITGNYQANRNYSDYLLEVEEKMNQFTQEQIELFDGIIDNPRVLVQGGAGTGKSFIAVESVLRLSQENKRILYLTFNKLIAADIKEKLKLFESVKVINFHNYILEALKMDDSDIQEDRDVFYKETIIEKFIERSDEFEKYDFVLIDEGQDLIRDTYLMCVDQMLKGGLEKGHWAILYDPNQNIFNTQFESGLKTIVDYRPAKFKLKVNCRNTRNIGHMNRNLTGIDTEKYGKLNGEKVVTEYYSDNQDAKLKIRELIKKIKKQRIDMSDVMILSTHRFSKSVIYDERLFESICKFQVMTSANNHLLLPESLKYCTIHSFKGLEAKVIILVDIKPPENEDEKALLYTGISRANTLLYLFFDEKYKAEINSIE